MTTPPDETNDPLAPPPGATAKQAKDNFWAKMAQATAQDVPSNTRPTLAHALATGTASPDDLAQINSFVRALDTAKTEQLNAMAGINVQPGSEAADLLNSIGENPTLVARAKGAISTAQDAQDVSGATQWFDQVGKNVADYLANSGDLIFPQTSVSHPDQNPDGSSGNWFTDMLSKGLTTVANAPGWLYREAKSLFETEGVPFLNSVTGQDQATTHAMQIMLGLPQQQATEKALGYDPNNVLSNMAFNWTHGQAAFNNLTPLVQTYGQDKVNAAVNVFMRQSLYKNENDALTQYVQDLAGQVQAGKLTADQYAQQIEFLNSNEFADVYHAVDMQHSSFGRDTARLILPKSALDPKDSGLFTFVSGLGDAAFDMVADPTLAAGKVTKAFQLGKYGVDMFNATKVSRLLGVADKVTGTQNFATRLGGRVQDFLDQATKIRELAAEGDHVGAAALHADLVRRYSDLTPFLESVNGKRLAITPEQLAEAKNTGATIRIGEKDYGAVTNKPITTLDDFRDYLVDESGLARLTRTLPGSSLRMMPGKVGIIQKALGAASGATAARGVAKNGAVILNYLKDADKIVPSDWSELFQQIANARGTEQFDALQGQLGLARKMRASAEQMNRRLTSLLPTVRSIAFNSDSSGADIERLARISLPKYEASILRYIWDNEGTTDAIRRAIGRGIVNTVSEAAGLTRSVVGRQWLDDWNKGMDALDTRRYGLGDTDKMPSIDGQVRRAAMNMSQIETHLSLPSFEQMRMISAKAAILGYDRRLADKTLGEGFSSWFTDASGQRDIAGGLANMAVHPWRTAKFGLLNSSPAMKTMSFLKMGWLLTSANTMRQMLEEYTGIASNAGRRVVLRAGKKYLAMNDLSNQFIVKVHNLIPSFRRHMVVTTDDAGQEIIKSKMRMVFGGGARGTLSPVEQKAVDAAVQRLASPNVLEALGSRQAGQLDGIDVAILGHKDGVPHVRVSWNGKGAPPKRIVVSHDKSHFKGYTEDELNGDSGRAALSDMYGQMFHDEDEPALRALAHIMWEEGAKNPAFLAQLPPKTLAKMEELVPPTRDDATSTFAKLFGSARVNTTEFEHHVLPVEGSKTGKLYVRRYGLGAKYTETRDEPLDYIYRVVSHEDYARMKAEGVLNTDGRGSHGRFDENGNDLGPLMFGAISPKKIALSYGAKDEGAVLLKIKYRVKDGWKKDVSAREGEGIVSTRKELPLSAIVDAAPFRVEGDFGSHTLFGTDGKLLGGNLQHVIDYVGKDDRTAVFRQRAERLNTDQYGDPIRPGDTAAQAQAVQDYVIDQIKNVAAAVTKQSGKGMHVPLVSQLLDSKVPSPEELQKFSLLNLPAHVIRAEFEPAPIGNIGKLGTGITQIMSNAFDKVVTNPMYRLIRKPLFTGMFVNNRVALEPWARQLVEEFGWQPERADELVNNLAEHQALQEAIRYIDNPAVRSQFSVLAQNVWLFYRAQEDWARRWSRILTEDPTLIRKAHMAIMAGVHGGMLDRDADGNLTFSYPGSGAVIEGLMHVANLIEGHPGAMVPHVDDLTSKVTWLNPALMNPLGFSASPAVSIPFDFLASFIPGGDLIRSQADLAMNGQQGNGRAYWEQFMPSAIRRLIQLTPIDGSADNTGSTVGSAAASAVVNAALLGKTPDGGDDVEKQKFITNTQTQTLNALIARSVYSFFAPGTPSMPELYGEAPADFSYRAMGIRSLKDEWNVMVAQMGYENALVVWHDLHPDKMIVPIGKTESSAKGASVDPTFGSAQWVLEHKQLFDGPYSRVAAYFIPPAPGQFDQAGWNTLTEIGVRQHKDLSQYYTDIVSKNAVTSWFDAEDDYKAALAAVTLKGSLADLEQTWQKEGLTATRQLQLQSIYQNAQQSGLTKKAVEDAYTQKKTDLYSLYPVLHSYFAETTGRKDTLRQMVNELTQMVQDPTVKGIPDMDGAAQMLIVKDNYEKAMAPLKGQRSTLAMSQRQDLADQYDQEMQQIVAAHPNLKDLYNGVFRYLENG